MRLFSKPAYCAVLVLLFCQGTGCGSKDPVAPVDRTPPAATSDLRVFARSDTSVTVKFTAPGNDGHTGTAAQYDLRYSTAALTAGNWDFATPVDPLPSPQTAGLTETITVFRLNSVETYYFGIKARDNNSNWSGLSNVVSTADPRTFYVCPGSGGDFTKIQDAVFHSSDGDTLELCDGTYKGSGNRNINYHGRAITVRSASGNPQSCVIDCEDLGRGFVFSTEETANSVVEGISVTNAYGVSGGAVYIGHSGLPAGARPKFVNCIFANSTATSGGGMYCDIQGGSGVTLNNCVFSGNTGTGLYLGMDASATITGCRFDGNNPYGMYVQKFNVVTVGNCWFTNNVGRGLYMKESTVYLNNSVFDGNTGGGLHCHTASIAPNLCVFSNNSAVNGGAIEIGLDGSLNVTNCTFTGNDATSEGGAIYADEFADLDIENCAFSGNSATFGGALSLDHFYYSGWISVDNCSFFDNVASNRGGAVDFGTEVNYGYFRQCTFAENSAATGSATACGNYSEIRMNRCIVAFGLIGRAMTCSVYGTSTMSCCDVYGNAGGDWESCISGQLGTNNNISVDPLFCGLPGSGVLTLRSDSQCATASCGIMGAFPVACSP